VAEEPSANCRRSGRGTRDECLPLCEGFQFHAALERTLAFIKAINRYAEQRAPWKLAKSAAADDQARLRTSLATMAEALRLGVTLLAPVMPTTTARVGAALGHTAAASWSDELQWGPAPHRVPDAAGPWCCSRGRRRPRRLIVLASVLVLSIP